MDDCFGGQSNYSGQASVEVSQKVQLILASVFEKVEAFEVSFFIWWTEYKWNRKYCRMSLWKDLWRKKNKLKKNTNYLLKRYSNTYKDFAHSNLYLSFQDLNKKLIQLKSRKRRRVPKEHILFGLIYKT